MTVKRTPTAEYGPYDFMALRVIRLSFLGDHWETYSWCYQQAWNMLHSCRWVSTGNTVPHPGVSHD